MENKLYYTLISILCLIIIGIGILIVINLEEFYEDWKCSIEDYDYFIKNKCERFINNE